jgi:hypothetical protein
MNFAAASVPAPIFALPGMAVPISTPTSAPVPRSRASVAQEPAEEDVRRRGVLAHRAGCALTEGALGYGIRAALPPMLQMMPALGCVVHSAVRRMLQPTVGPRPGPPWQLGTRIACASVWAAVQATGLNLLPLVVGLGLTFMALTALENVLAPRLCRGVAGCLLSVAVVLAASGGIVALLPASWAITQAFASEALHMELLISTLMVRALTMI